jgi:putative nucleotidyltransferase with HDIG domain
MRGLFASPESRDLATKVFYGIQVVAAAIVIAFAAPQFDGNVLILGAFIALNIGAQFQQVSIYGQGQISVGFVVTLAIIMLFGVSGVVIAAPIGALAQSIGKKTIDWRTVTNGARWTLIYATGAVAYGLFGETNPEAVDVGIVIGGLTATLICFLLSLSLIIVSSWLRTRQSVGDGWEKNQWVAPHYAAMGVVGVALTAAYIALGFIGVLAFVTPALMMRLSMKQYVDKTAENVVKLEQRNTALTQANIQIQSISDELRVSYDSTLEALVNALDARDQETKGHSLRVQRYMMDIAREMGVKEGTQEWLDMQRGSLLHDVGKIGVSDTILLKPGKLTEEEWHFMRQHPQIGFNMLNQVNFLKGASQIILAHHERWDGHGYPKGLAEEEIPFGARIFMVCDTFDSMTSDRPYRKALSTQVALEEILKYRGSQFDPQVVEAFLDIFDRWVKERDELHALELDHAA